MVSISTMIAVIITFCVSTVVPILALVIYALKNKGKGVCSAWFLGAAGFFVLQMIIRIPVLNLLSVNSEFQEFAKNHYIIYCLILAFTAALFEVIGRYAVAKMMSKNLTYQRSLAAGMGHGGIEAILLIGMTYLNNMIYISMINGGTFDAVVEQTAALGVDVTSLLAVKDALLNTNSVAFLLAGYERVLTMIFHAALSLTVCYFVSKKKDAKGIIICLACHWFVDFLAPLINGMATEYVGNMISETVAYVITYVFLTLVAGISMIAIREIRKKTN